MKLKDLSKTSLKSDKFCKSVNDLLNPINFLGVWMRGELKVECCSTSADEVIISIFTMKVYLDRLIQSTYLLAGVKGDLRLSYCN